MDCICLPRWGCDISLFRRFMEVAVNQMRNAEKEGPVDVNVDVDVDVDVNGS